MALMFLVVASQIVSPAVTRAVTVLGGDGTLSEQRVVADRIAVETTPTDPVVVLTAEPQYYFMSN